MIPGQEFAALANCHAPGMYSIPLQVSDIRVERMFIDSLGTAHTVAPHNHRYDLTLTVLRGALTHTVWTPDEYGAVAMYRYQWSSPIDGGIGQFKLLSDKPRRYDLSTDRMYSGEWAKLRADQVHSLVTTPGTVWMVSEGLDTHDAETLWFTPEYAPDLTGLYVPLPVPSVVAA